MRRGAFKTGDIIHVACVNRYYRVVESDENMMVVRLIDPNGRVLHYSLQNEDDGFCRLVVRKG